MAQFRPYKYIKEFYNADRLVLPALRDQLINSIFLGKSTEATETLLDNQDVGFFDLWKMCINHYRYSFFETIRGELIVVPDMMSCLPPLCNVIFPDEYVHYGRRIQLRGIVTRFFEQGFQTVTPNLNPDTSMGEAGVAANEAFVAPTSDIQPLMGDIIKAECTGVEVEAGQDGEDPFIAFRQVPLPEELHYGAQYYTGEGEYLLRAGENSVRQKTGSALNQDSTQPEEFDLVEEYNNFHKLNVLYKYFLTRLQSQKTEQVRLTFTPRLIPGLPVLLLSRTGRHIFGLLTAMSHIIDANGVAETHLTIEYQYLFDDSSKRPLYIYKDHDEEPKEKTDQDGYMWKNYFMLSHDFRDKEIGEKMYHDILCDEISETDYNPFAKKLKKNLKKDYSILGIHHIFKTLVPKKTNDTTKTITNVDTPVTNKPVVDNNLKLLDFSYFERMLSPSFASAGGIESLGSSEKDDALYDLSVAIMTLEGGVEPKSGTIADDCKNPGNIKHSINRRECGFIKAIKAGDFQMYGITKDTTDQSREYVNEKTGEISTFIVFSNIKLGQKAVGLLIKKNYLKYTLPDAMNIYAKKDFSGEPLEDYGKNVLRKIIENHSFYADAGIQIMLDTIQVVLSKMVAARKTYTNKTFEN